MKRVIGIVSEGPTDQMAIRTVIDRLTGEKNIYRYIQPEQDARGEFGNGWKGVYRWCENNAELIPALFSQIMPRFDALIIHMDGDVSRKEKEVHCKCGSTECDHKDKTSPLDCIHVRNDRCPVQLPCSDHEDSPESYRAHLTSVIRQLVRSDDENEQLIITIPCDSTDAWIVAAFDDLKDSNDAEMIIDPWSNIISLKKEYHGIRVPGHKRAHQYTGGSCLNCLIIGIQLLRNANQPGFLQIQFNCFMTERIEEDNQQCSSKSHK